jgi:hypothetical protein
MNQFLFVFKYNQNNIDFITGHHKQQPVSQTELLMALNLKKFSLSSVRQLKNVQILMKF